MVAGDDEGSVWDRGPAPDEPRYEHPAEMVPPRPVAADADETARVGQVPRSEHLSPPSGERRTGLLIVLGLFAVIAAVVIALAIGSGDAEAPVASDAVDTTESIGAVPGATTPASSTSTSSTSTSSTSTSSTSTSSTSTTTVVPSTTTTAPTAAAPTTTPVVPSTPPSTPPSTAPEPATTVGAVTGSSLPAIGPRVLAVGRTAPCRFGNDCLVVDFAIEQFDTRPGEFVCEFDDGSRYTYRFDTDLVENACVTSSRRGAVVVEVDGVRSLPVTRP